RGASGRAPRPAALPGAAPGADRGRSTTARLHPGSRSSLGPRAPDFGFASSGCDAFVGTRYGVSPTDMAAYDVGVPAIIPAASWMRIVPVVTVGGPAKKSARFCFTQSAARLIDSSAPALSAK